MISFDNTKNAFAAKTDADLNRSYWLFKLVSNPAFVNMGSSLTQFALNFKLPIKGMIKATIFKQFCGGETIEDSERTIRDLNNYNIGTILDYSVEGKESEKDFDNCRDEVMHAIKKASTNKAIPFSVFKPTGVGRFALLEKVSSKQSLTNTELEEYKKVKERVNAICELGSKMDVPVLIDAEESWIQNAIDEMADEMMSKYNRLRPIVYNTYQLYRKDRLDFLNESLLKAQKENYLIGAKLVRGAYMEKERARALEKNYSSPINNTKEQTDEMYNNALKLCVDNIDRIALCAGTHNELSAKKLIELMEAKGISKDDNRIYFSQLLGMSDHISYNLAHEGYNVAKYVPYGPVHEVLPYLIRRAQENTSVKGQTGRELSLIIKEKKRRKG